MQLRGPLLFLAILLFVCGPSRADEPETEAATGAPSAFEDELVEVKAAHKGLVRTLAFHPTAQVVATGGSDRALRLWDPGAEKPRAELVLPRYG